jgi:DNA helicase HerA-like ATPase
MTNPLTIARNPGPPPVDADLVARMANRHGLIAGATGTGKTVTLRVMAEAFSRLGVPVFLADVKGDLSGIAVAGAPSPVIAKRISDLGLEGHAFEGFPVTFWDLFGAAGHPVRTTVSDMGPLLLTRLLNLNATQAGVLDVVFRLADDNGLLLLDLKDLRAMLQFASEHAAEIKVRYGNVSAASVGAIQRGLLALESQGGDRFFGEPALDLDDMMQTDARGFGVVNVLAADRLMQSPKLYATFLLWLLSELFERLPEVGDVDRPKLAFFFDEAHLLFDDASPALLDKIEQVVRLVRSKGVGVYFATQNPLDLPESVLGQLGNRVQHALRAFTPKDQRAVRAAAQTFRAAKGQDVEAAITELGVGEALVSFLDANGTPTPALRGLVLPPSSRLPPLTAEERRAVMDRSIVKGVYDPAVDRESAFEKLAARVPQAAPAGAGTVAPPAAPAPASPAGGGGPAIGEMFEAFGKSVARAAGSSIGREIVRGMLGSIFGGAASTATRRRRR